MHTKSTFTVCVESLVSSKNDVFTNTTGCKYIGEVFSSVYGSGIHSCGDRVC